jgi:hypothetical protein
MNRAMCPELVGGARCFDFSTGSFRRLSDEDRSFISMQLETRCESDLRAKSPRPFPGTEHGAICHTSYGVGFENRVRTVGMAEILAAPRLPWQNPNVERTIGSIRRECVDHAIIFNEADLRRDFAIISEAERISH